MTQDSASPDGEFMEITASPGVGPQESENIHTPVSDITEGSGKVEREIEFVDLWRGQSRLNID